MNRVKIYQDGELVGSIPRPDVNPQGIVSFMENVSNQLGDPLASVRRMDFAVQWQTTDNGWTQEVMLVADRMLGLGDFENLRGFDIAGGVYDPDVISAAKAGR